MAHIHGKVEAVGKANNGGYTPFKIDDVWYSVKGSAPPRGATVLFEATQNDAGYWNVKGKVEEILDREVNVVKAFVKSIMPSYAKDIDALQVECEIKPFIISDEKELIDNLVTATGGKAIISQKEAIEYLGWSNDSEATLKQIADEENIGNAL